MFARVISLPVLVILLVFCILFTGLAQVTFISDAHAQTQAEAIREINTLLRSAERSFHGGKLDEMRQELDQIQTLLEAAEAQGDNPQLKGLRTRHERLAGNLDKRVGTGTPASRSEKVAKEPAPAPAAVKLSASDARKYRELNREMEKTRSRLTDSRWWELAPGTRDNRIKEAGQDSQNFRAQLDEIAAGLDPAYLDADTVRESEAILTEIHGLIRQRGSETEPAKDVAPAVAEALVLEKQLLQLHKTYYPRFQGVYGSSMVHGTTPEEQLRAGRSAVGQLDALERDAVPALQPVLLEIADKYGHNAMDINNALFAAGLKNEHHFGGRFMELYSGLENLAKSRRASSQDLALRASQTMAGIGGFAEELQLKKLVEAREMLALGRSFDAADPDVNRLLAEVDALHGSIGKRIEKDIDARQWAGNITGFDGPGKTTEISKAALDYIRKEPAWNPPGKGVVILAAAVQGPWDVGARDLLGRVVQWRIPVHVAVTNTEMKKDNIARVYELSVLTRQGGPDRVEKKPPFVDYWVGNSWNVRLNNVPAQK